MPFIIDIDEEGASLVAEHMDESGYAAVHAAPVIQRIYKDLLKNTATQFYSQGRRAGGSWKKLAPSTVRRKGHSAILQDTKALIHSVTRPGATYQIWHDTEAGFVFGTDRPHAEVHQHGDRRGHVPARPFLVVTEGDVRRWDRWMMEHITRSFT